MRIMLLTIGVCILALTSNAAYETTPDGLTWKYEIKDGKAVIVCREESVPSGTYPYITYDTVYTASISSDTAGAVSIPETLGGCPVVSLEHDAMCNCAKITSLTLPSSITNISGAVWSQNSSGAFYGCTGLTEVHICSLDMLYNNIVFHGDFANPFDCGSYSDERSADLYVDGAVVTEVIIPEGVTEVNDYAFCGWPNLTKIVMPHSVTNIGKKAFYQCSRLYSVNLPPNLISIGESAFSGCVNISHISIPPSVETIGEDAFGRCGRHGLNLELSKFDYGRDISRIVTESYVTSLAFTADLDVLPYGVSEFTNLVHISIPSSVTYISPGTFDKCRRLKTEWIKTLASMSEKRANTDVRYDLSNYVADRAVASITVDTDSAIDEFVLVDGKVYDVAIRIANTAAMAVHITLPDGYVYESFLGAAPLTLPAKSINMLTITRTGENSFLVARRQLQAIAQ